MKNLLKSCAALAVLSGCDLVQEARLFAFSYEIVPVNSGFVTAARAGQVDVADLLSPNRCFVALDLTRGGGQNPVVNSRGQPGDPNYNVFVGLLAPVNTETQNPAACGDTRTVQEITLNIGGPQMSLDVGDTVDATSLNILIDGQRFVTSNSNDFFRATLQGFDGSTRSPRVTADFEAIAVDGADMVLVSGSFSLD